jgi:nucleotide-binding universal stress UspA family protein
MILICYDGSEDAKAAIAQAGALFDGQPAIVLTVWERFTDRLARTPAALGMVSGMGDTGDIDQATRKAAEETADEGAGLARQAGLDASPRIAERSFSISTAILGEADRANAGAIVLGSRGLGGVGSFFLGSVSHAVVQHADRAVVVIPSPAVAQRRNEQLRADADASGRA